MSRNVAAQSKVSAGRSQVLIGSPRGRRIPGCKSAVGRCQGLVAANGRSLLSRSAPIAYWASGGYFFDKACKQLNYLPLLREAFAVRLPQHHSLQRAFQPHLSHRPIQLPPTSRSRRNSTCRLVTQRLECIHLNWSLPRSACEIRRDDPSTSHLGHPSDLSSSLAYSLCSIQIRVLTLLSDLKSCSKTYQPHHAPSNSPTSPIWHTSQLRNSAFSLTSSAMGKPVSLRTDGLSKEVCIAGHLPFVLATMTYELNYL
jgi:hypothetical protein